MLLSYTQKEQFIPIVEEKKQNLKDVITEFKKVPQLIELAQQENDKELYDEMVKLNNTLTVNLIEAAGIFYITLSKCGLKKAAKQFSKAFDNPDNLIDFMENDFEVDYSEKLRTAENET
jgi:hypothetical protein